MAFQKSNWISYLLVLTGNLFVVLTYRILLPGANSTTVALSFLLVVLLAASYSGLGSGIVASVSGMVFLNYFFLPPVGMLTIDDPQNWVALGAFLVTAFVASELSSAARLKAEETEKHRQDESNLYQLSRAIILSPDPEMANRAIARQILEIFHLDYCGIFLRKSENSWDRLSVANELGETDSFEPSGALMHEMFLAEAIQEEATRSMGRVALYVPLKLGVKAIGAMVVISPQSGKTVLEAIAGLVALALERARFLNELSRTRALEQSDELKSAILASVSHDLRTPLTSIRAAIDSILEDSTAQDPTTLREFHLIIREDVDRLSRLVENLLEMARIESSGIQLSKQWESVSELFQNTLSRCADSVKNHRVKIEMDGALPLVKIDSRLLSQVLSNLIDNACKYSPEGTEILLRAWIESDNLFLSVGDQGPGIPPNEAAHIFEKFYRLKDACPNRSGTGMGLAIARGIVRAHGGEIWVETNSDHGSTFICNIPAEQKAQILSV